VSALRSAVRALYVAWGALVVLTVMSTLWLVTGFVRSAARAIRLQRAASRTMLTLLGVRVAVHGAWPARDGVARVYVCNHTSYLDIPLMLAVLPHDFVFVTKRELLDWPIISRITRAGGHIPVDRERATSRGATVARIIKTLRAGRSVFIFPEGTFSHDDKLRPFHQGAFHAAAVAGAPVVPVATKGVDAVWSQHARFPSPGRVGLTVGEALVAEGADEPARAESLRGAAARFVAAHSSRGEFLL
jgi:1-acyl-sn-glycerol-3-phosphate acyltransferase